MCRGKAPGAIFRSPLQEAEGWRSFWGPERKNPGLVSKRWFARRLPGRPWRRRISCCLFSRFRMERLYTSCSRAISETSRRSKTDVFLPIAFHFCVLKTHETVSNGGSIVDRGRSCLSGTVLGFCLPSRLCTNRVPLCSSAKVPALCLLH